jgi:hypothetical protein
MRPVHHPAHTRTFGAPADWSPEKDGECSALEIADVLGAGGLQFMESRWEPDDEELAALQAGGAITLGIQGVRHPVVYLAVAPPPVPDEGEGEQLATGDALIRLKIENRAKRLVTMSRIANFPPFVFSDACRLLRAAIDEAETRWGDAS